jgi:hypothetical protein
MRLMQAKAQDKKEIQMPEISLRAAPIALVVLLAACSAAPPTTYSRPTPSQAVRASQESVDTPEWLKQRDYRDGGPLPPMEANRKVNEQSCTTGVNLEAGNLKCK